ncbi:MAG: class I adenylate-forming enzyme family protein, partial [Polyangiaceae bacterium]
MPSLSIHDAAREVPQRSALIAGDRNVTYAEGAELAARARAWLADRGARAGDRVALVATAAPETIFFVWALVEIGASIVLLHPRLTDAERAVLVHDASPSFTIDDAVSAFAEAHRMPRHAPSPPSMDPEQMLALLFTSGTTGRSKAAMLSRRAFLAAAHASEKNLGWEENDRWLLCMPPAHVGGLSIVIRCLLARRTVVLAKPGAPFDPDAVRADIDRHAVTIVSFVPTMLQRMLQAAPNWNGARPLRAILLGGAGAPPKLIAASADRHLPVLTTYGLTEACSQVTTQKYGAPPSLENGAGVPVEGMEVRIESDRIWVRGKSMMSGYFSHASQPSPFTPDGWFPTGDIGRIDERGNLHVLGRHHDLVVTGGENVYPADVESEIERISGVRAACVFGMPDETWGEIVCVAVVREAGVEVNPKDLSAHVVK